MCVDELVGPKVYYIQCSRVNEYTPFESNILNNISMTQNIFQNVDKTKFYITSCLTYNMK